MHHHRTTARVMGKLKIARKLIAKSTADNRDLQLTILDWRNIPTVWLQTSPAHKTHIPQTLVREPHSLQQSQYCCQLLSTMTQF